MSPHEEATGRRSRPFVRCGVLVTLVLTITANDEAAVSRNERHIEVDPSTVFRVLSDPRLYAYFVVGTRRIRHYDPSWPAPGARIHHSLGAGVTLIRDHTESLEAVEARRVAMRTFMRPLAVNDVTFELTPDDGGTAVTMTETAVDGPAASPVLRGVAEALFWIRNQVVLRRLRRVTRRFAARSGARMPTTGPGADGSDA